MGTHAYSERSCIPHVGFHLYLVSSTEDLPVRQKRFWSKCSIYVFTPTAYCTVASVRYPVKKARMGKKVRPVNLRLAPASSVAPADLSLPRLWDRLEEERTGKARHRGAHGKEGACPSGSSTTGQASTNAVGAMRGLQSRVIGKELKNVLKESLREWEG